MKTLLEDFRAIAAIHFPEGHSFIEGVDNCARIEVYKEKGPTDFIPYFAVFTNTSDSVEPTYRIPAYTAAVQYRE